MHNVQNDEGKAKEYKEGGALRWEDEAVYNVTQIMNQAEVSKAFGFMIPCVLHTLAVMLDSFSPYVACGRFFGALLQVPSSFGDPTSAPPYDLLGHPPPSS